MSEIGLNGFLDLREYSSEKAILRFNSYATDEGLPVEITQLIISKPSFKKADLKALGADVFYLKVSGNSVEIGFGFEGDVLHLQGASIQLSNVDPDESDFRRITELLSENIGQSQSKIFSLTRTLNSTKRFAEEEMKRALIKSDLSEQHAQLHANSISVLKRLLNKLEE